MGLAVMLSCEIIETRSMVVITVRSSMRTSSDNSTDGERTTSFNSVANNTSLPPTTYRLFRSERLVTGIATH